MCAQIYDRIDLFWTSRGDYFISEGDLTDTFYDPLRSVVQEIKTRIEADQGDWENFPTVGAGIRDFVGEPNNANTAEMVKTRLISSLARDGLINTKDITVKYLPISHDKLMVRISIKVAPTARNASSEVLILNLVYSYSDNNVYFMGV